MICVAVAQHATAHFQYVNLDSLNKSGTEMQIAGSILLSDAGALAATILECEVEACPDATQDLHSTAHFQSVNKISK